MQMEWEERIDIGKDFERAVLYGEVDQRPPLPMEKARPVEEGVSSMYITREGECGRSMKRSKYEPGFSRKMVHRHS